MLLAVILEAPLTTAQRLALRISQVRKRLGEITALEGDDFSDEVRAESATLETEYGDLESRHRAALISEAGEAASQRGEFGGGDGESAELRRLLESANVGAIFTAAIEQRSTSGAERELQEHYGMGSHAVPLALLETRAAATTQAPANVQAVQQPTIPAVFATPLAEFMGVERVSVPVGVATFPVMTAPESGPASVDEGESVDDSVGTWTADALRPRRLQVSFVHSREDTATFANMDADLRQNLSDSIGDGLDREALVRTGEGLLDFGTDPTLPTVEATWTDYRAAVFGRVDGRYADNAEAVRMLVGAKTYEHMAAAFRTGNNAEVSALAALMRESGGVRVSAHVPAPATDDQQAVLVRGSQRHSVQPVWNSVEILIDPYSESKDGNIRITAIALAAMKVVRPAGYFRTAFQLA